MGIISNLVKVAKKKFGDLEEATADKFVIEELTQDIRDGKKRLAEADEARIDMRAQRAAKEREIGELESEVEKYKGLVSKFKANDDIESAKKALLKFNEFNEKLESTKATHQLFDENIKELDQQVEAEKSLIERIQNEVATVEANKKLLDAQEAISSKLGAGRNASGSASASLERAKAVNAKRRDRLNAQKSLGADDDLEAKAAALDKKSSLDDQLANF